MMSRERFHVLPSLPRCTKEQTRTACAGWDAPCPAFRRVATEAVQPWVPDDHFFSTFHRNVTGATMTPVRLERYAVGMMNCAVVMYGRNLNASSCTASAAFLPAAA